MKKFLGERFVPVWIDDKQDDMFAAKLGLSQEGYPNIAVYDGASEYLGRVIGFRDRDAWFKNVQDTWAVSAKIADVKAAAEKDAALWGKVAEVYEGIPGREKDALSAVEKIPEAKRPADYAAAHASLEAKAAWVEVDLAIKATTKDAKKPEDVKAAAPKGLALLEAWIQDHGGKNAKLDPMAWARKGNFMMILDRKGEAMDIVAKIFKEWPDSAPAQNILRSLRAWGAPAPAN